MSSLHHHAVRLLAVFLVLLSTADGQGLKATPADTIDRKVEQLDTSALPPELLEQIRAILAEARSQGSKHRAAQKRIPNYQSGIQDAPGELTTIKQALADLPSPITETELAPLPASEVKIQLIATEADLLTKQNQLETLNSQTKQRTERLADIPGDIAALSNELATPPAELLESKPTLADAWEEYQSVRDEKFISDRRTAMELEQKFYAATGELQSLRKRLARQELTVLQEDQKTLQQVADRKSTEEASAVREEVVAEAEQFSDIPALAEIANENANLARQRETLSEELAKSKELIAHFSEQLDKVGDQSRRAQERIQLLQSAGMEIDAETGRLLRLERASLPTIPSLKASFRSSIKASTKSQIEEMALKNQIVAETLDIESEVQRLALATEGNPEISEGSIRDLIQRKRTLQSGLAEDYGRRVRNLNDATENIKKLIAEVQKYSLYLDERLIWIASASRIQLSDLAVERAGLEHLFVNDFGQVWLPGFGKSFQERPITWIAVIILLTILIIRRRHYRQVLKTAAELAGRRSCTSIRPTWKALVHTVLIALPVPLLLLALSWLVASPTNIRIALLVSSVFVFLFTAFRRMSGRYGIFRNHFQMTEAHGKLLYRHLTWFLAIEPLALFLSISVSETAAEPQVGRLLFILAMALLIVFVHSILRPKLGLIPAPRHFQKLPHLIYLLGVAIPLLFILGSSFGYISSVETLRRQTMASVWLILICVLLSRTLERWILVCRRELARSQARKAYQARLDAAEKERKRRKKIAPVESAEQLPTPEEVEAQAIDMVTVEDQTKKLVRIAITTFVVFGVFNIWASSLPALSFLDRVTLWGGDEPSVIETISDQSGLSSLGLSALDSGPSASTASEPTPAASSLQPAPSSGVSLQDVVFALLTIFLTILAAKNLPGLLELSLLRRLDLKPGGNYAITTILRYTISAIGLLIAFGTIGVSWSSVQWLAAAITLGIGFGLQEIFANFVAGIILLFERPMRLGDVVTIGDVSGSVSKIEMRATTIRQFNSRELIVPNKEFITGQLVNWTLSDDTLRFDVNVGVAYGSDTQQVSQLLEKIADDNSHVLDEPRPQIIFTAFGASTLDFTLRAYIQGVKDLVPAQSQLHYQIDEEFRKAGIEIAFPQTDIHIRSLPAGQNLTIEDLSAESATQPS